MMAMSENKKGFVLFLIYFGKLISAVQGPRIFIWEIPTYKFVHFQCAEEQHVRKFQHIFCCRTV